MRIFLGLGGVKLFQPGFADHLGQRIDNPHIGEKHRHVKVLFVRRHGDNRHILDVLTRKAVKVGIEKRRHDLAHPVGAEVVEEQTVTRLDLDILLTHVNCHRQYKLIGGVIGISFL